jgi:hypothetical protein
MGSIRHVEVERPPVKEVEEAPAQRLLRSVE